MAEFSVVKRGYNPSEVEEYVGRLEQIIRGYKEKDAAIKNAIVNAQVAADNIIKNAHLEVAEYKSRALAKLNGVFDSIENQRKRVAAFQNDYNSLVKRYMNEVTSGDVAAVYARVDELENFLKELTEDIKNTYDESDRPAPPSAPGPVPVILAPQHMADDEEEEED
jgi:DivIVA domain-containing protein